MAKKKRLLRLSVLVVLLNGSPEAAAEKPVLTGHQIQQSENYQNSERRNKPQSKAQEESTAVKTPSDPAVVVPEIDSAATDNKANRDNREPQKKWDDWFAAFGPATWADWTLALLGLIAAAVGLRTLHAIHRQADIAVEGVEVNRMAAEAAHRSAEVAIAALRADRPYIFIARQELIGFSLDDNRPPLEAKFTLTNAGKGPAIVKDAKAKFHMFNELLPVGDFSYCTLMNVPSIIEPGESLERTSESDLFGTLSPALYNSVVKGTTKLVLYGVVVYRDVFDVDRQYETKFLYEFQPRVPDLQRWSAKEARDPGSLGQCVLGPKEYNVNT
jgi:hypothetical protein